MEAVQLWKSVPRLELGLKGAHDFTLVFGSPVAAIEYFTTSFWLIKEILTHKKADIWGPHF